MLIPNGILAISIFYFAYSIFEKSKVNGVKNKHFIFDVSFHPYVTDLQSFI